MSGQKTKEEITQDINRKFGEIIFGLPTEKYKIVLPIADNCISLGMSLGLDEVSILKFAIIQYHRIISEIMTDKYYQLLFETADIKTLVTRLTGEKKNELTTSS